MAVVYQHASVTADRSKGAKFGIVGLHCAGMWVLVVRGKKIHNIREVKKKRKEKKSPELFHFAEAYEVKVEEDWGDILA